MGSKNYEMQSYPQNLKKFSWGKLKDFYLLKKPNTFGIINKMNTKEK